MGLENVSVIKCFSGLEDLEGCKKFLLKAHSISAIDVVSSKLVYEISFANNVLDKTFLLADGNLIGRQLHDSLA
jgi:hypothetical protein